MALAHGIKISSEFATGWDLIDSTKVAFVFLLSSPGFLCLVLKSNQSWKAEYKQV
jgi:hypothetical protein